jgi:hypothetical protein
MADSKVAKVNNGVLPTNDFSPSQINLFLPKLFLLIMHLMPFIIPLNVVILSSLNKNLKGFVFLFFLLVIFYARLIFYYLFTKGGLMGTGYQCWTSSFILSFTFAYVCAPMMYDISSANASVIAFFLISISFDFYLKRSLSCHMNSEAVVNCLAAFAIAGIICHIMFSTGYLFFTETSNRDYCENPKSNVQFIRMEKF